MIIFDNLSNSDCNQQIFTVQDACHLTISKFYDANTEREEIHFCFHSPFDSEGNEPTIDVYVADDGSLRIFKGEPQQEDV